MQLIDPQFSRIFSLKTVLQRFIHFELMAGNSKEMSNFHMGVKQNNKASAPFRVACDQDGYIDLLPTMRISQPRARAESTSEVTVNYWLDISVSFSDERFLKCYVGEFCL